MGKLYRQLSLEKPIDIAYTSSANYWNGQERLQLKVRDIKISH